MGLEATTFPVSGRRLYVGEGDFSLTRSLAHYYGLPEGTVVTCFSQHLTEEAKLNKQALQLHNVTVIQDVDATRLEEYPQIAMQKFDYIVFNFPHTGHKMKIQLCRALLRDFLCSAAKVLATGGQVWVTLCGGQGGTPGDTVRRDWGDTWQIAEQAATAGLVLTSMSQFRPEKFPLYRATGNRSSETRTFHTRLGVTHKLTHAEPVLPDRVSERLRPDPTSVGSLRLGSVSLPLSQYWQWRIRRVVEPGPTSVGYEVCSRILNWGTDTTVSNCGLAQRSGHNCGGSATSVQDNTDDANTKEDVKTAQLNHCSNCDKTNGTVQVSKSNEDHSKRFCMPKSAEAFGLGSRPSTQRHVSERRLYLRNEGFLFRAVNWPPADCSRDITLEPVSDEHDALVTVSGAVCLVHIADLDVEIDTDFDCCPFKTKMLCEGSDDEHVTLQLSQFGITCEKKVCEDNLTEFVSSVGERSVCVARARSGSGSVRVVEYDIDRIVACWVQSSDWRHVSRADYRVLADRLVFNSIYPVRHVLDLSFWLDGGDSVEIPFSWARLRHVLRAVFRHVLVSLKRLDEYMQPTTGRRALTVRLVYQDLRGPLSFEMARDMHVHKLPSILRAELGVDAR